MKKVMIFGELSIDQIRSALNDQLATRFGTDDYCWIRDMFPETGFVVYERDGGKLWKLPYTITDSEPKLGSDEPVEVTQEYVPAAEFADFGGQLIEIFRAGDYGNKGNYTAADLKTLAETYDPAAHEAPIVIGHPKTDAPAMGWAGALKTFGDTLFMAPRQVDPKFEEAVKAGRFKKRSVAFSRNADGTLMLRHVGFLGAAVPEVRGLSDVKFAAGDFTEIEFSQEKQMNTNDKKTFVQNLREGLAEIFGVTGSAAQPKTFSEAEHNAAVEAATKPLNEKITAFEAAETARTSAVATFATKATELVNKLKADGKWIPAFDKMGVPAMFSELAKTSATIEFAEGNDKKQKPAVEVFADFMGALPKIVPTGELSKSAKGAAKGSTIKFSAAPGIEIDQQSAAFAEACNARAHEKKITFGAAMIELAGEGWKPAEETATGQV